MYSISRCYLLIDSLLVFITNDKHLFHADGIRKSYRSRGLMKVSVKLKKQFYFRMPVGFDRHMVGYAAPAYLDDVFDRYATLF